MKAKISINGDEPFEVEVDEHFRVEIPASELERRGYDLDGQLSGSLEVGGLLQKINPLQLEIVATHQVNGFISQDEENDLKKLLRDGKITQYEIDRNNTGVSIVKIYWTCE